MFVLISALQKHGPLGWCHTPTSKSLPPRPFEDLASGDPSKLEKKDRRVPRGSVLTGEGRFPLEPVPMNCCCCDHSYSNDSDDDDGAEVSHDTGSRTNSSASAQLRSFS